MSEIAVFLATIWNFQIVRFWNMVKGNYLVIPDSSRKKENAESSHKFTGITNGGILDHIADISKSIIFPWRFIV